jgi:hypothetical protein
VVAERPWPQSPDGATGDVFVSPLFVAGVESGQSGVQIRLANQDSVKNLSRLTSTTGSKARNVLYVLVGVAALVLKKYYAGPGEQSVHNYGGNVAASFAVYFLFLQLPIPTLFKKPVAAALALAVVELFEAFDGFGVMTNTYDPFDFVANALGVALALTIDCILLFRLQPPKDG